MCLSNRPCQLFFVPPSTPVTSGHTVSDLGLRYCDTYQLRLCVTSVVVITLSATVVRSHDSMDVGSLSVQTSPSTNFAYAKGHASGPQSPQLANWSSSRIGTPQWYSTNVVIYLTFDQYCQISEVPLVVLTTGWLGGQRFRCCWSLFTSTPIYIDCYLHRWILYLCHCTSLNRKNYDWRNN